MPTLHIQLLDEFRLVYGDEPVMGINAPRLQSLLAYLVLHRDAPQPRQYLAFLFWPDSTEAQARTNLRKVLHRLRRALPDAHRFLDADTNTVQWRPDAPISFDVADFERTVARAQKAGEAGDPTALRTALEQTVDMYSGDLLPSCYDDWIVSERERLYQTFIRSVERLIQLLQEQREYRTAIRYAQRLLRHDPLYEAAYRRLMRLYALGGDRAGALRVYHDCVTVLQRELGVEPNPRTQTMYERLLSKETSPIRPVERRPTLVETSPLVGRQQEWQSLQLAWRRANQGRARFVAIIGEAGIGKTRLAEELLTWADRQGITTARTRSYATEGSLAYSPVTELLRTEALRTKLAELGDVWLVQVARLLPELLEERPDLPHPEPLTESWQRQRFLEALARAVLGAPQQIEGHPLLLVLDDVHWCDQETLEWLHYLMRFDPKARLLVVGTVRAEDIQANHPLRSLLLDLQRDGQLTEVELVPLNADETASLAAQIAGQAVDVGQAEQLYRDTEGNPLFVVETVRAVAGDWGLETGDWRVTSGTQSRAKLVWPIPSLQSLPPKVEAVIQSRLVQLTPQAQELASLAATIGRSFTYDVLVQASQDDEDVVIQSLDELWQRRIIREQGMEEYDFSHDKIREFIYSRVGRSQRRLLHRQVAQALERVHAANLDSYSGELAAHYQQTGVGERARAYMRRAGEWAAARFANDEAVHCLSRALDLTPPGNLTERYELLLARERVHHLQGKREAQKQDLIALKEIAEALTVDQLQIDVALRQAKYAEVTNDYSEAIASAQRAIHLAQAAGHKHCEAMGHLRLGVAYWRWGNVEAVHPEFEQALCLARAAGSRRLEAESLRHLGNVLINENAPVEARTHYKQSLDTAREIGDRVSEAKALGELGLASGYLGDLANARNYLEESLLICRETGSLKNEGEYLNALGLCFHLSGDDEAALECCQRALGIAQDLDALPACGFASTALGHVLTDLGRWTEAIDIYRQALDLWRELGSKHLAIVSLSGLARVFLLQGSLTQAGAYVEEILAQLEGESLDSVVEPVFPVEVYLTCYRVLRANHDPRAQQNLDTAIDLLHSLAAKISDEELRRSFLENVPAHQEVLREVADDS